MTEINLTAIACSVYKPELEALAARNALPEFSIRFIDSALHMDPARLQDRLRDMIEEERLAGAKILLLLGDCSSDMAGLTEEKDIVRVSGANCGEIFLGKDLHKQLIKDGAFILLPEWAARWKEILLNFPGLDVDLSRSMMRDMHKRFVYLDTGVRPIPDDALKECGEFFGLPVEVLDVELDHLTGILREAAGRFPAPESVPVPVASGTGKDRNATAVMMLDIITEVLKNPGDVSDTAFRLSQKLRELTGARLVILVSLGAIGGALPAPRVLVINPSRHRDLLESDLIRWVIDKSMKVNHATLLSNPTDEQKAAMRSLGITFCPCLLLPLFSGGERVGAILSLGLLDTDFVGSVLEIEDILSGTVSVILKNALLQEERLRAEETLRKSDAQVRLLLDSTAEAIYGIDLQGHCTFANPACLRMLGYKDMGQLLGQNMHRLIHYSYPDGRPMAIEDCHIYRAFREGRGMHRDDEFLWKADGTGFPAEYWSYPQFEDGKAIGSVVTFLDITERKKTEAELALKQQRLVSILEGTNVGTWEWNVQTGETIYNERWAEMIGYTLAELEPVSIATWTKLLHQDDQIGSEEMLKKHFSGEFPFYDCEVRMRHKNGMLVWVRDRGKVTSWTEEGKPLMMYGTHEDITGRKIYEERIQHLATHDALTGLPGLRLANDRLDWSLGLARRSKNLAAVIYLDLDGFKEVNDSLGHNAGDFVLKAVAQRMQSCVRETDTLARVGGDEFLLIATSLNSAADAAEIARKIVQNMARPIVFDGKQVAVGTSIGIALYPTDSRDKDELIRLADKAMYEVKASGKNNFGFARK